jgi:pyruvate-formate lyase-activating enzyme
MQPRLVKSLGGATSQRTGLSVRPVTVRNFRATVRSVRPDVRGALAHGRHPYGSVFGPGPCNLACRGCQNWELTTARSVDHLGQPASPDELAATAARLGCRSVAFTYNDPVVFHEYAVDVAHACRARGLLTVAVTAGSVRIAD